ncbi:hypothetical protein C0Q70_16476 [Pomacea canaliculata]|uniref:Uncharacterized protein n=1 Tax=Pomacea canaliculata TaxID=400727 RepID=A0A2T7NPY7_POMCA|nr:hypothetical protein C0Q70_16476 [Pomacea canaliculata]
MTKNKNKKPKPEVEENGGEGRREMKEKTKIESLPIWGVVREIASGAQKVFFQKKPDLHPTLSGAADLFIRSNEGKVLCCNKRIYGSELPVGVRKAASNGAATALSAKWHQCSVSL